MRGTNNLQKNIFLAQFKNSILQKLPKIDSTKFSLFL